jgi:hypothetical protein
MRWTQWHRFCHILSIFIFEHFSSPVSLLDPISDQSKMQVDLVQKCKVISSWDKFTKAIKKQFYPLAHTQMTMIEWQHLRQGKGQNIQAYTHEFKKKALS